MPDSPPGLRGDQDDEDVRINTSPNGGGDHDADADGGEDRAESRAVYYDRDDGRIADFGRAATAAEARPLTGIARRYEAAASRADGQEFCGLLKRQVARSAPSELGNVGGPAYLRGDTTCAAVMSGLLAHMRRELPHPMAVTRVRVGAEKAFVLLGSRTSAASYLELELEHDRWTIAVLLPTKLP